MYSLLMLLLPCVNYYTVYTQRTHFESSSYEVLKTFFIENLSLSSQTPISNRILLNRKVFLLKNTKVEKTSKSSTRLTLINLCAPCLYKIMYCYFLYLASHSLSITFTAKWSIENHSRLKAISLNLYYNVAFSFISRLM